MLAISVIVPAYQEGDAITPVLARILHAVKSKMEILVVVDAPDDSTMRVVERCADERVRVIVNTYGPGPANAIRFGFDHAAYPVVVVTMADGSDDPEQIDILARLVERGVVVAAASRYSAGGQQVGAPPLKSILSKFAGRSLRVLARVGTYDATNSFKAYSAAFVREVGIDSRSGFEIGIELTAKARRMRLPVAEIPTIWLERASGASNFRLAEWIPRYLRWYRFSFGPRMDAEEIRREARRIAGVNGPTSMTGGFV